MKQHFFQNALSLSLSYFLIMQITLTGMSGVEATGEDWDEDGDDLGNGTDYSIISDEIIQSNLLAQFGPKPDLPLNNLESLRILLNTSLQYTTLEELVDDLENWRAPAEMRTKYPYYLSGHDDDGRPVWIGELGRWDVRRIVEEGGEAAANFDKYMRQCYYRAIKSLQKKESPDDPESELLFIFDFDELPLSQVVHVPTLTFGLKLLRDFAPLLKKHTGAGFIINANYVTERLLALIRPILGSVFEKIEVFGNNKSRWIPHLLRRVPKDQLPHWYGGPKDFEPVAVYG